MDTETAEFLFGRIAKFHERFEEAFGILKEYEIRSILAAGGRTDMATVCSYDYWSLEDGGEPSEGYRGFVLHGWGKLGADRDYAEHRAEYWIGFDEFFDGWEAWKEKMAELTKVRLREIAARAEALERKEKDMDLLQGQREKAIFLSTSVGAMALAEELLDEDTLFHDCKGTARAAMIKATRIAASRILSAKAEDTGIDPNPDFDADGEPTAERIARDFADASV